MRLLPQGWLTDVQMWQSALKHDPHEIRGAPIVGRGLRIACRRRDPKTRDGLALEPQPVADIIETEGVRQLDKHKRSKMAPDRVAYGLGIHPMLPGGGFDGPLRNILEKLPQHIDMMVVAGRMGTKLFWFAS